MGRYVKINNELVPIAGIGGGGQDTNFKGSLSDWNALTQEEKNQYDTADLIDDYTDVTDEVEQLSNSVNQMGEQVEDLNTGLEDLGGNVQNVENQLIVDGTKFYFDSHDGKYGYNTSSSRGADTFFPFSNIGDLVLDQTITIPKGTQRPSITFTNEANLILFYCLDASRYPSLWYKTIGLAPLPSAVSITSIASDKKTCTLNIPNYGTQYYAANLI